MDTFDTDSKSKDEVHNKIKAELAATSKSLDDKIKEIAALNESVLLLNERHEKTLKAVSSDYQQEIDALQGNSGVREELEALQAKHDELNQVC